MAKEVENQGIINMTDQQVFDELINLCLLYTSRRGKRRQRAENRHRIRRRQRRRRRSQTLRRSQMRRRIRRRPTPEMMR